MPSIDSHIVILRPLAEDSRRRIVGYATSKTAAEKLARNPRIKLKPFDMLIAGPVEIANILVLYETPLSIFIVDPSLKIRKAPELYDEFVASGKNWMSAWDSSTECAAMLLMCQYMDPMTRIRLAGEITRLMLDSLHADADHPNEVIAYNSSVAYLDTVMHSGSPEKAALIRLPVGAYYDSLNSLVSVIQGNWSAVMTIVERFFIYSFQQPSTITDVIRAYAPLPMVLLGKHLNASKR